MLGNDIRRRNVSPYGAKIPHSTTATRVTRKFGCRTRNEEDTREGVDEAYVDRRIFRSDDARREDPASRRLPEDFTVRPDQYHQRRREIREQCAPLFGT